MPHVRVTFFEDQTIRDALKVNITNIETLVANEFGYPQENIKIIPEPISPQDQEIASNIDGLVFSITAGSRVMRKAKEHSDKLTQKISTLPELHPIHFIVLLQPHQGMVMSEHKPS